MSGPATTRSTPRAAPGSSGSSDALNRRTAVETGDPLAVDIETDELIFFPLLYWPVTADAAAAVAEAVERINRYLETGGTILFDTRDGDEQSPGPFGGAAIAAERLRRLTAGIKMPPLVPIPPDHVLTKSFYLMHEFPGRWNGGTLWVEPVEDHVNDGVSSVIVGANDWAGAWAVDKDGRPLYAVVPGGEQQREMALRFGINLVMYVLTGNYKARSGARAGDPGAARPMTTSGFSLAAAPLLPWPALALLAPPRLALPRLWRLAARAGARLAGGGASRCCCDPRQPVADRGAAHAAARRRDRRRRRIAEPEHRRPPAGDRGGARPRSSSGSRSEPDLDLRVVRAGAAAARRRRRGDPAVRRARPGDGRCAAPAPRRGRHDHRRRGARRAGRRRQGVARAVGAPLHVLLSGQPDEGDRRLVVTQAPSFGIVGKERAADDPGRGSARDRGREGRRGPDEAQVTWRKDGGAAQQLHGAGRAATCRCRSRSIMAAPTCWSSRSSPARTS